jgi:haloalkane dehalogenase
MTYPDYPFQSHFLDRNGIRYHFLDEGAGEPIVMLHGNPTWSYYYRHIVLALRDSYRIIVPDHIGCGLSDKPDDSRYHYTLASRVNDLEALLNHLGLDTPSAAPDSSLMAHHSSLTSPLAPHPSPLTLVLHDWGGIIGMAYASRHLERIRRLIILDTAAFHLPPGKRLPWSLRVFRLPILGAFMARGLNAFCRGAADHCCTRQPMSPEIRAAYLAPYNSWKNRIAVHRFVQDIPLRPGDASFDLVSEIQDGLTRFRSVPMLICWGEKDFVFDKDFLAEWQRHFPEAEIHRFPDAGHYVLEDVGEEIIQIVRHFLAKHS